MSECHRFFTSKCTKLLLIAGDWWRPTGSLKRSPNPLAGGKGTCWGGRDGEGKLEKPSVYPWISSWTSGWLQRPLWWRDNEVLRGVRHRSVRVSSRQVYHLSRSQAWEPDAQQPRIRQTCESRAFNTHFNNVLLWWTVDTLNNFSTDLITLLLEKIWSV